MENAYCDFVLLNIPNYGSKTSQILIRLGQLQTNLYKVLCLQLNL